MLPGNDKSPTHLASTQRRLGSKMFVWASGYGFKLGASKMWISSATGASLGSLYCCKAAWDPLTFSSRAPFFSSALVLLGPTTSGTF